MNSAVKIYSAVNDGLKPEAAMISDGTLPCTS
jgi:hypothetical protein